MTETGKHSGGCHSDGFGINVRCLDDVEIETLTLTPFDGKSL
jgi:hypothetical protein